MSNNLASVLANVQGTGSGAGSSAQPLGMGSAGGSGFGHTGGPSFPGQPPAAAPAAPAAPGATQSPAQPIWPPPTQWLQPPQPTQPQGSFLQQPALTNPHMQFPYSAVSIGSFPGVPSRFITQIQRGEFVNFDSLYSALVHGSSGRQGYSLALDDKSDSDKPTISILKQSSETGKIKNFSAWSRAWLTFMSIFVHFRPHLVSQLMAYHNSITQLASTYYASYWLAYDAAFRQKMANNQFI